jgi:predicted methyltransferase
MEGSIMILGGWSPGRLLWWTAVTVALGAGGLQPAVAENHEHHGAHGSVEHWLPHLEDDGRDAWQRPDHLVELLEIEPGMTVADLGAGTGYFLSRLSSAVGPDGSVLALDVDPELVEFVATRCRNEGLDNIEARTIPLDDPELEPGTVDRVLTVNTWHHIDNRGSYAAKLASALAPGGRVVVVDFTRESPHGPPVDHRLTTDEVRAELEAGGFETAVIDEELPHQYVVVARRPAR